MSATVRSSRSLATALGMIALCAASVCAQSSAEGRLQLDVHLPAGHQGRVAWAVFNSADGFPNDKLQSLRHGFSPPSGATSSVRIDAGPLPAGRYAVAVYLDENGNGRLDRRFPGIPKEPVGASNNPAERRGPPRFTDCAFALGSQDQVLVIRLVDPK